jgi:hypothetical protein
VARYVWITERQVKAVERAVKDAEHRQRRYGYVGSSSRYEPDRQSVEREQDRFAEEKRADADALKEIVESVDVVAGLSPIDEAADAALDRSRKRDQEKKRHEAERTEREETRKLEAEQDSSPTQPAVREAA